MLSGSESHSVLSDSLRPHGLQPTRLLRPWDFPGKSTGVGCRCHLLELDILKCEVKWALGGITTNKVSGGDGLPVELFQILKDDAVKVLHSICQQIWKTQQWLQDLFQGQFSFQSQRKAMPENVQTTAQLYSSHMLAK